MRALMLEVDERMLAERHRLGLDHGDEMWEGVLHMVPAPFARHGRIQVALGAALLHAAQARNLLTATEIGVIRAADDYRIPDIAVYRSDQGDDEGIKGAAELVVEIRSPGDETYDKLPWYLARGAVEVLIVDRDTLALELHRSSGRVAPDADGFVSLDSVGVRIGPAAGGPTLIVESPPGRTRADLGLAR